MTERTTAAYRAAKREWEARQRKLDEAKQYLQRWADMDVAEATVNDDGSVSLFLISLLGDGFDVRIEATRKEGF